MISDKNKELEIGVIDITQPRWSQKTFQGRLRHFIELTHPKHMFHSSSTLNSAQKYITDYRSGNYDSFRKLSVSEQWKIKYTYDSAHHPDTGDRMFLPFRMCAQIPSAIFLNAGILTYHHTFGSVLLWQWINQSFMATLNYTNRNATSKVTNKHILAAYASATTGAITISVLLNSMVTSTNSLSGRLIPFLAVAMANAINTPLMRQNEIKDGVTVSTEEGVEIGKSRRAAVVGIFQTFISRIAFCAPSFIITPIVYTRLIRIFPLLYARKPLAALVQGTITGLLYLPSIPIGCSIFPQRTRLSVKLLEPNLKQSIQLEHPHTEYVHFNKGL